MKYDLKFCLKAGAGIIFWTIVLSPISTPWRYIASFLLNMITTLYILRVSSQERNEA